MPEIRKMSRANMTTLIGFIISLIMVIFFFLANIYPQKILFWSLAIISFLVSMICDLLDGYFARLDNTASDLGGTLDHMRDKMTMLMVFSPLLSLKIIHWPFLLIIFFREFFVIMIRLIYLITKDKEQTKDNLGVSAKIWGKIKTVSQTISVLIFSFALFNYDKNNHLSILYSYIHPYLENPTWQMIHVILEIIIIIISITGAILYALMYKEYIYKALLDIKEKN